MEKEKLEEFFEEFKSSGLFEVVAKKMDEWKKFKTALKEAMEDHSKLLIKLDNKDLDDAVMETIFNKINSK